MVAEARRSAGALATEPDTRTACSRRPWPRACGRSAPGCRNIGIVGAAGIRQTGCGVTRRGSDPEYLTEEEKDFEWRQEPAKAGGAGALHQQPVRRRRTDAGGVAGRAGRPARARRRPLHRAGCRVGPRSGTAALDVAKTVEQARERAESLDPLPRRPGGAPPGAIPIRARVRPERRRRSGSRSRSARTA